MECFWLRLPLFILRLGASGKLACPALAGVWMNMAGNKTNDFYAQLEPYVTSGEGAVSRISQNELFPSCRSCQTISDPNPGSESASHSPTACPDIPLGRSNIISWFHL